MDEDLERLLPLLGDYLCNRPCAITAQDMATLTADGLPAEEPADGSIVELCIHEDGLLITAISATTGEEIFRME